jgi:hypothetical protein
MAFIVSDVTKMLFLSEHDQPEGQQLNTKGTRRYAAIEQMCHKPTKLAFNGWAIGHSSPPHLNLSS